MSKPYVIAVSGGSGSGKTHLISQILKLFNTEEVSHFPQDNYYKKIESVPKDENGIENFDRLDAIDFDGLGLSDNAIAELLRVEVDGWLAEIPLIEEYYAQFGSHIPVELTEELANLKSKLEKAKVSAA